MFKLLEIESRQDFVGRAAAKGVADSINFFLINTASNAIRQRRAGVPEASLAIPNPVNHVDNYDEAQKDLDDAAEERIIRAEQGFVVLDSPEVVAAYLKVIYEYLDGRLHEMANTKEYQSKPGYFFPIQFDIPTPLDMVLERRINSARMPTEAAMQQEARDLHCLVSEVRLAAATRIARQTGFLKENAKEIIDMVSNWHLPEDQLGIDHEQALDALHPLQHLRLLAGADNGLWFEKRRTLENPQGLDAVRRAGNLLLIKGRRQDIFDEIDRLMRIPSFQREVQYMEERGSRYPRFNPTPAEEDALIEAEQKRLSA